MKARLVRPWISFHCGKLLVLGCSFTWCKLFILFMIVYDKNKDASLWIGSIRCSYFDSLLNFRHFYCFILTRHIWYCYSNNYQVQSEFVDLPSQSASKKHSQEKKPTNLCAPRAFIKTCLPCLIIIQSCYFDRRINKT